MIASFEQAISHIKACGARTISVAVAQDREMLLAIKMAADMGLAKSILVGDKSKIRSLCNGIGLDAEIDILHEPDDAGAALLAAKIVRQGKADILVKGLINSADFLRAALDPHMGLRSDKLLSHIAAFQLPFSSKLVFHSDGGMNIAPNLEEKEHIVRNAVNVVQRLGVEVPKVAILAANERPARKMPATTDAQTLVERWKAGVFPPCIIEGPVAMDVALSREAAEHKGIHSDIAGDVDVFIMPNIEAGNIVGKTLVYYAGARIAGFIAGALKPIVLVSRSDKVQAKIDSIVLACLASTRAGK